MNFLKEMAYPADFDWEHFSSLESYDEQEQYCDDKLHYIGNGSSRIAFRVDDERVLKLAFNEAGVEQNRVEATVGADGYVNDIFAGVLSADLQLRWIEMYLCDTINRGEFEEGVGIPIHSLRNGLYHLEMGYFQPDDWADIKINPTFVAVIDYVKKYGITEWGDLFAIIHWGRHPDGRIVLLDYGLTDRVYKKFYADGGALTTFV